MSETSPPYDATRLPADVSNWLESCRRKIEEAKVAIESNGRLNRTELAALASDLESVWKKTRALVIP